MRREGITDRRRLRLAGTLAIALAVTSGCGQDATQEEGGANPRPTGALEQEETTQGSPSPQATEGDVDLLGARDAALREYPGGTVYDVELEEFNQQWSVELVHEEDELELEIDAQSGEIVEAEEQILDEPDVDLSGLPEDSLVTAVEAALEESGGDQATEAELTEEGGRRIWEIEIDDEQTFGVDAETGEIRTTGS
ncbi:PepSY domain-containing protein [Thermobifida halotolerans]|uniref:PepSY domain-containing protein n=1 Tax=Thermobifida halotolerans TaxID=483545 RepID=A0A399G3E1_9ACTN|nr:PepSY domain-containing protein [Thermobifida halotolerans]UOE17905.1 PepSY domain-containing protein [Thermobifida halotolerans]